MAKYQEIYKQLLARIRRKDYPSGSYLPSENELMETYSCSRDTIRKALNLLAEKGYILKEQGKGSKVLDQDIVTFPMSGLTSFQELANANDHDQITTQVVQCETGNTFPWEARNLNLNADDPVTRLVRVRSYNGERVILDKTCFNPAVVPGITPEVAQGSVYSYIENDLKRNIGFAKKEITVEPASAEEKELLDMEDYDLLVVVRSYTYLEDASLFEYCVSKHRPDKFRFLDFARREKI